MISYMLVTIIIISTSIFLVANSMRNKKISNLGFWLIMIIMFSLSSFRRYDIGNDTFGYFNIFDQISKGNLHYDPRIEIGYRYLNEIGRASCRERV